MRLKISSFKGPGSSPGIGTMKKNIFMLIKKQDEKLSTLFNYTIKTDIREVVKILNKNNELVLDMKIIISHILKNKGFDSIVKNYDIDEITVIALIDIINSFLKSRYFIYDNEIYVGKNSKFNHFKFMRSRSKFMEIFGVSADEYLALHESIIVGLRAHKWIIKSNKIKNTKDVYSSFLVYEFWIFKDSKYSPTNFMDWNKKKIFIYGRIQICDYLNIKNIYKSKKNMKSNNRGNLKFLKKMNNSKIYINKEFLRINKKLIEAELGSYLKLGSGGNIYNLLNKKKSDLSYNEHQFILDNFEKINTLLVLKKLSKIKGSIRLNWKLDNRLRVYNDNRLSLTNLKEFRFVFLFEEKKLSDQIGDIENSMYYKKMLYLGKGALALPPKNNFHIFYELQILKTIGAIFKNEIEKENKIFISLEGFIEMGKKKYNNRILNKDFNENLYLNYLYFKLDRLGIGEIDPNLIIYVDSTASGLQNMALVLKCKEFKKKYLNLSGDKWCDTYTYLAFKLLENHELIKKYPFVLDRIPWKRVMMTIPYGVSWSNGKKYFIEGLSDINIDFNNLSETEQKELIIIYSFMFKNLKLKKLPFYINNNLKDWDLKIDINYTYLKIVEHKKQYKGLRDKFQKLKKIDYIELKVLGSIKGSYRVIEPQLYKQNPEITNKVFCLYKKDIISYIHIEDNIFLFKIYDYKKTESAFEANLMHNVDSGIIRHNLIEFEFFPIHDSAGIRIIDISLYYDKLNKYYGDDYSIFIQI